MVAGLDAEGAAAVVREGERFGGVDVLVNNAGIMDRVSAPADVSDAEWERVLQVNLTAPFLLTRAVLPVPHMLAAGRGAIVNTASEAALRGSAAGAACTASRHGVVVGADALPSVHHGEGTPTAAPTARRRQPRTS